MRYIGEVAPEAVPVCVGVVDGVCLVFENSTACHVIDAICMGWLVLLPGCQVVVLVGSYFLAG